MLLELILATTLQGPQITYTNQIRPIMELRCFQCHGGRIPSLPDLSTYDGAYNARKAIKRRVWDLENMPPGGGGMNDVERKMIKMWVDQGAKE